MCLYSVGYKYYDLKTTTEWIAEQHKIQRFIAFALNWILGCGEFKVLIIKYWNILNITNQQNYLV